MSSPTITAQPARASPHHDRARPHRRLPEGGRRPRRARRRAFWDGLREYWRDPDAHRDVPAERLDLVSPDTWTLDTSPLRAG